MTATAPHDTTTVAIRHLVGVESVSPDPTYLALTTLEGLRGWWTRDTTGDPGPGGTIAFRFDAGGFDMDVIEVVPHERVVWTVVDGPEEWVGTTIHWTLAQRNGHTDVTFVHAGWREPVSFMHHCSTKWATYLVSLKHFVETGTGAPAPGDLKITDWD